MTADADRGGALEALSSPAADQLPGTVRGFIWPTEFLMFTDFVVASPHAHSALQLVVGLDGPTRVRLDDVWHEGSGVLVDTDVTHGLDASSRLTAVGWIEAESRIGWLVRDRVLGGQRWTWVDPEAVAAIRAAWRPALQRTTTCAAGHQHWRRGLQTLTGQTVGDPAVDERIRAVLDHLRRAPSPPPAAPQLARLAHLSESRLQHLFREQVGVPVRRYLLWHRILTAMSRLADGGSVTDAAHAAGFADAAHLTRVTQRMNGVAPSDLGPVSSWLSNCR